MSPITNILSPHSNQTKPLCLANACQEMIRQVIAVFEASPSPGLRNDSLVSISDKIFNEAGIQSVLDELTLNLAPWQGKRAEELTEEEKDEIADLITGHLVRIDEGRYLFDEPFLSFFIGQGYLDAARDFTDLAGQQDKALKPEETFQALRNVWIMNSLQLMWGIPLAITPAVYAYSMLYPYTDNFLDDPSVSREEKSAFNRMVARALQGETLRSDHPSAARIQELIRMIRSQYPPGGFPQVIGSIELIQAAQTTSVRQDLAVPLGQDELELLSFYKGGASVLADAYLVKGILSRKETEFAFFYGSFLQLVDDLQDARSDLAEGHQTLYSTRIREGTLDSQIPQLLSFIGRINEPADKETEMIRYMKNVIGACSRLMVLDVLGRDPSLVSPSLYEELEGPSKVRLSFFKKIANRLEALMPVQDKA